MMTPKQPARGESASGDLWLKGAMGEALVREGRNYSRLARAIEVAVGEEGPHARGGPRKLDRRKLKAIVEGDPELVLSLRELRALDLYLQPFGQGLASNPIFERPDLLRVLASTGRVTFLLGSKPDEDEPLRVNMAQYDVLAMAELQRGLLDQSDSVRPDIHEVRMLEKMKSEADAKKVIGSAPIAGLFAEDGPSLVCVGSVRGNLSAEAMLCRMFDVPVFTAPGPDTRPLPFRFIWSIARPYVFKSHLQMRAEEFADSHPAEAKRVLEKHASGLWIDDTPYIDELTGGRQREGGTYGVCVAQRRARGQIWLLVAGLTGPATLAAAGWAREMTTRLAEERSGTHSNVYWSVIKALATREKAGAARGYHISEPEVVVAPQEWSR